MFAFFYRLLGWKTDSLTETTDSTRCDDEQERKDEKETQIVNNDLLSRAEFNRKFPCISKGYQYVSIRELAGDASRYYVVPMEDALFVVAAVAKFNDDRFDHILAATWTLITEYNYDTPHNRLVGIIEEHKSQIKTISIDKKTMVIYIYFISICRFSIII